MGSKPFVRFDERSVDADNPRMTPRASSSSSRAVDAVVVEVQRLYPRLFHACHERHVRRRSTVHRLSPSDSALLAHLDPRDGLRPKDLARHLGIGAPTLSAALARLETLGLLARVRDSRDQRALRVVLTERGSAAMSKTSVLDPLRLARLVARMTDAEQRLAVGGLSVLARAAREEMEREFRLRARRARRSRSTGRSSSIDSEPDA
jgi:DNA-binding MarR family transcriptional regulator